MSHLCSGYCIRLHYIVQVFSNNHNKVPFAQTTVFSMYRWRINSSMFMLLHRVWSLQLCFPRRLQTQRVGKSLGCIWLFIYLAIWAPMAGHARTIQSWFHSEAAEVHFYITPSIYVILSLIPNLPFLNFYWTQPSDWAELWQTLDIIGDEGQEGNSTHD